MNKYDDMNALTLAYIGDAYFELYVRDYLINLNILKIDELNKKAQKYVSASGQNIFLKYLIDNNILTLDEINIVKKGRNVKRNFHPKNTSLLTYKHATGFEALVGYLYLTSNFSRLDFILSYIKEV